MQKTLPLFKESSLNLKNVHFFKNKIVHRKWKTFLKKLKQIHQFWIFFTKLKKVHRFWKKFIEFEKSSSNLKKKFIELKKVDPIWKSLMNFFHRIEKSSLNLKKFHQIFKSSSIPEKVHKFVFLSVLKNKTKWLEKSSRIYEKKTREKKGNKQSDK